MCKFLLFLRYNNKNGSKNMNTRSFLQKVCLILMVGTTLAGCSKGEEITPSNYALSYTMLENSNNIIKSMSGVYSGQWTLNGNNVDAEQNNNYFSLCADRKYGFEFTTFPFKAIATQILYQYSFLSSVSITKLTTSKIVGVPLKDEDLLLFKTIFIGDLSSLENAKEDFSTHIGIVTDMYCVGYSENLVYFELSPYTNYAFLRYPFVVTLSNGEYYAIVMDVVPSKSTLTLDSSSRTINFVCNIPQIEIYDSEGNKNIIEPKPELVLTFTSTNKTKAAENGN